MALGMMEDTAAAQASSWWCCARAVVVRIRPLESSGLGRATMPNQVTGRRTDAPGRSGGAGCSASTWPAGSVPELDGGRIAVRHRASSSTLTASWWPGTARPICTRPRWSTPVFTAGATRLTRASRTPTLGRDRSGRRPGFDGDFPEVATGPGAARRRGWCRLPRPRARWRDRRFPGTCSTRRLALTGWRTASGGSKPTRPAPMRRRPCSDRAASLRRPARWWPSASGAAPGRATPAELLVHRIDLHLADKREGESALLEDERRPRALRRAREHLSTAS